MIELSIHENKTAGGASVFSLSPPAILLGGKDAAHVDAIHFSGIPDAWKGMTVRVTFVPAETGGETASAVLDDAFQMEVPGAVTRCAQGGRLVVDATDGDYHAYTRGADYSVYPHPDAGGQVPALTDDAWTQLVSQLQGKAGCLTVSESGNPLTLYPDGALSAAAGVSVAGRTAQDGTGDPAPGNVRPITGVGKCDTALTLDGSADEGWSAAEESQGTVLFQIPVSRAPLEGTAELYGSWLGREGSGTETENFRISSEPVLYLRLSRVKTEAELRAYLAVHPLTVWYQSAAYAAAGAVYVAVSFRDSAGQRAFAIKTDQPLYAGDTADLVTGSIRRGGARIDLGTLTWTAANGKFLAKASANPVLAAGAVPSSLTVPSGAVCSALSCVPWSVVNGGTVNHTVAFYGGSSGGVFACDTDCATADAFRAAMSGVWLWFPLAAPAAGAAAAGNDIRVSGETVVTAENTVTVTYPKSLTSQLSLYEARIRALEAKAGA